MRAAWNSSARGFVGGAKKHHGVHRALVWLVLVAAAAFAIGLPGASRAESGDVVQSVTLEGHGLGHGIGLSQWGAEERAAAGFGVSSILGFYYPGTTLGTRADVPVRVLVASGAQLRIGAWGPFAVQDAAGKSWTSSGLKAVSSAAFDGAAVRWPLELTPISNRMRVGGVPYAGSLKLVVEQGRLLVVNVVDLESYIQGVVSAENPAYWHLNALESQAIAARTFALSHLRPSQPFDLWSDDRSQNYVGLARDFPSAREAVADTAGRVLVFRGRVADAMFSASNGGLTSAGNRPYLISRPDAFDADSPAANWGPVTISAARLHYVFGSIAWPISAISFRYDASQRVIAVDVSGTSGQRTVIAGVDFQQRLGLHSTFFTATVTPT